MIRLRLVLASALMFTTLTSRVALAQAKPAIEPEAAYGKAWFLDDSAIPHRIVGGALKWRLLPRLAVGPEVSYMVGPGDDRDLTITGNLTFDFRRTGLTPFVVAGAGLFRHRDRFGPETFTSTEGGFTAGGGVRIPLRGGWYLAPEARIGWEPHTRLQVGIGRSFKE